MGQVYRIFNKNNGKSYIGATTKTFPERYLEGRWWAFTSNTELLDDAYIFGAQAYSVDLIADNVPRATLKDKENEFIRKFNSLRPNGYNVSLSVSNFLVARSEKRKELKELAKLVAGKEKQETARKELYRLADEGNLDLVSAIKLYRKVVGKNQQDFAKFIGIAVHIVQNIEQGNANPTVKTIDRLLRGSGLTIKIGRKNG